MAITERPKVACPLFSRAGTTDGVSRKMDEKQYIVNGYIVLYGSGRIVTGSKNGADLKIDATYETPGEGWELRWAIVDWADVNSITQFQGLYLRVENQEAGTGKTLRGAEITARDNNVGIGVIHGLHVNTYIKGATDAITIGQLDGIQAQIEFASNVGTRTVTNTSAALHAIVYTAGTITNVTTKVNGIVLIVGDQDGQSTTIANGLLMEDSAGTSGTCALTTGININIGCATGISIAGACSTAGLAIGGTMTAAGISISGTAVDGIKISGVCTEAIEISSASGTGISISGICTSHAIMVGSFGTPQTFDQTANYPLGVFAGTAADITGTSGTTMRGVWVRAKVANDYTAKGSIFGIQTTFRWQDTSGSIAPTADQSPYYQQFAGLYAAFEMTGTGQTLGDGSVKVVGAAIHASVGEDAITVSDNAVLAGISIEARIGGASTITGEYVGIYIDGVDRKNFDAAIRIANDCALFLHVVDDAVVADADGMSGSGGCATWSAWDGWIKVKIGSQATYIPTCNDPTAS